MRKKLLFSSLIVAVVVIGLLHFFTPGHLIFYHNTFRRLSYFPIVLGGIWFGLRGGLTMAILSSIAFIPHLLLYIGKGPETYLSELTEIVLYLAAGVVVGVIAGRESLLKEQYRELSEKLKKSYSRLHEETEQLLQAEEQLTAAQKLSALGQMSASLAHEIKNPLSSIKGSAEILRDEFAADHPKREFVDILVKETARLQTTVTEILNYSRQSRQEEAVEPLGRIVEQVRQLLGPVLAEKKVILTIDDLANVEAITVPGGKMKQVLLNLLLNGVEAMAQTGGEIVLSGAVQGNECLVTVCDTGKGVPDSEKAKIFEPFYSGREEGTGLGLVISRKLVAGMGGDISVRDNPGGGACFEVRFPCQGIPGPEEMML